MQEDRENNNTSSNQMFESGSVSCRVRAVKAIQDFKLKYHFDFFNFLLTILCIGIYIFTTYEPNFVLIHKDIFNIINCASRIFFLIDFISGLIVSVDIYGKIYDTVLVELVSVAPYLVSRFFVGMKEDLVSNTHNICSSLVCFRIFRILQFSSYIQSDVNRELYNIVCSFICLILTGTTMVNVIENTQTIGRYYLFLPRDCNDNYNCDGTNDSFYSSLFFVFTTVATIGYYSTTTSVAGKCIIIALVLVGVFEIPAQSSNLMIQLSNKSIYARTAYKKLENVEFILISGNISLGSITVLLQEYFHPDHGENERHALILLPQQPDTNMKTLLQIYQNKLFYFEGDPLKINDLKRCQFKDASMIMLLCNKQTDDSSAEDSKTIIQAMAIKKFFTQEEENENGLLRNKTAMSKDKNFTMELEEKVNSDQNEEEENANDSLISSDETNPVISENNKGGSNEKESHLIIQLLRPESEHHFSLSISKNNTNDQIICIDELKLSLLAKSCLCRGIISLLSNLIITNNFEDGIEDKIGHSKWIEEYKHGKDYEIYKIPLNSLRGYKFSTCANKIYKEKKTILFGLNIEAKSNSMNIVLLSPMEFVLPMERDVNVYGYLLAKDQGDADNVTTWVRTQKQILLPSQAKSSPEFDMMKGKRRHFGVDDDMMIDMDQVEKEKDIYSTDALTFAKTCHITTEHIAKTSVTIDSIDKMLIAKDHIIICGVCQNLIDFIKPLRAKNLPKSELPTIVILSKELPDDKIWNSIAFFEQIYLVQGDPMNEMDLKRAGIKHAKRVVMLAPSIHEISDFTLSKKLKNLKNSKEDDESVQPGMNTARKLTEEEEDLLDSKTVFKYNLVSHLKKDIFCVIELINQKSVSLLNNTMRKNNDEYRFIRSGLGVDATASFASGEVYYSSIMDNLITQAYYNPSLLTVLKKLIIGEEQNTYLKKTVLNRYMNVPSGNLYLIDLPLHVFNGLSGIDHRIKFEDVFHTLLQKRILVIGVYRAGEIEGDSINNVSTDNKLSSSMKMTSSSNFYYVVTAPEENFDVGPQDKLFVICTEFPRDNLMGGVETEDNVVNTMDTPTFKINRKEEKKEMAKELDEETEEKIKNLSEELKETQIGLEDLQKCMNKGINDSSKIIDDNVIKKINSLLHKKNKVK